jgi:DNA-binding transcriptional ArsR family regulator
MPGDANVAQVASLLADPTRVRVLMALLDGRALPASDLARSARVSPSADFVSSPTSLMPTL